jgi:hypothetical protein
VNIYPTARIDEPLHALRFQPQLQTMLAVLICAGLHREKVLRLTGTVGGKQGNAVWSNARFVARMPNVNTRVRGNMTTMPLHALIADHTA